MDFEKGEDCVVESGIRDCYDYSIVQRFSGEEDSVYELKEVILKVTRLGVCQV